tara:strand:- start:202 stop:837 length:636 start_codon:yes stop_codon:yes gene_type:complete
MKDMQNIASLLPEGLSEEAIKDIASLVSETITQQVEERVGLLEAKVNSFLRTKVDDLKNHALAELEQENPVFRNARLFESVRTMMSLELNSEDEDNAIAVVDAQKTELQEEVDVLTQELNRVLLENETLQTNVQVLSDKQGLLENSVNDLGEENANLLGEIKDLEASQDKPFKSSEKALIVSEADEGSHQRTNNNNEFLTDEVMKFMPFEN